MAIVRRSAVAAALVLAVGAGFAALGLGASADPSPGTQPYAWRSVAFVGGGFVTGIVFHPTARDVRYCRTDIGGAYRWNAETKLWEPLLDWLPYEDLNLMGVESLAIDPSDPDRVYLSCGTYTNATTPNGAILRSTDRGRTFQIARVPFKMGGNENGRGNGERLVVDPNDGRVLFLGTRHAGLWKSVDAGVTWTRVASFPDVTEVLPPKPRDEPPWVQRGGSGVVFAVFDPRSGRRGTPSSTLYVGVSLMNRDHLFCSTDAGRTWRAVPGQPTAYRPNHAVLAADGTLYVSYGTNPGPWRMEDGGVWKLDTGSGRWTDITPEKPVAGKPFGYAAVAVAARDPRALIVSTFGRPAGHGEDEIFRSTDAGRTWKPVFAAGAGFDFSLAPYVSVTPIHWLFDVEIDPFDPDHALFTTGYGGYETFDLGDVDAGRATSWSVMSAGIEETVALDLLSPPRGAHLLTAIGDYGGAVHWDLDRPAPEGSYDHPHFGNTTGLACAENAPDVLVRVGRASHHRGGGHIGYSLDGGRTWQPTATTPRPDSQLGQVAVSADAATWVWTPERSAVSFTRDRGATWSASRGVPESTRVIADRVDPQAFYALALFDGQLFVSKDGAATFTAQPLVLPDGLPRRGGFRGDDRGGQDRLYATPGRKGDLWLAAWHGLYHTTDSGARFERLPGVSEIHGFGFGKAAPGQDTPALFLVGVVAGLRGVFRSDDAAASWVRINDDRHQWGLVLQVTGDPKVYGRVYVGTHGRGTLYGDPVGR
ncbi:MAG TPA: exo-alpha-sialidase [Vicinamibacteria bacterium]|nr:exo-alpha-sialidase [Vicinamibacteria bacterium]